MALTLRCPNPNCTHSASVADTYRGRTVRCPACKHTFTVSDSSEATPRLPKPPPPTSSRHASSLPSRIGRFEVKRRLGSGAFGDVYQAVDPQLHRAVALKVPRASVLDDPRLVERFLREGKAAAGLNHPHIVPVFDAGQDGDSYYIAAAFIDGHTLAAEIHEGPIDTRRAASLVQALAEALAYAHQEGIVHRDVKPANVLIDGDGEPYLTDFGLATRQAVEDRLTRDGAVMGTPAYMSPEQAQGQQGEAKPAVDQYALGVILYELLTRATPFEGPPAIVLYNVIHKDPDPPRRRNPEVPRDLETVCLKAMARDPDKRYPDCQELADDLRRWLDGEPVHARRRNLLVRLARWVSKEPVLVGLAVLTVICLSVVSVLAREKGADLRELEARTAELTREALGEEARTREAREAALAGKNRAEKELADADWKKQQAERRRRDVEEARKNQVDQRRIALEASEEVRRQEAERRRLLYGAYVELAEGALLRRDQTKALSWLDRCKPQAGQEDLRDDYWRDLQAVAEGHDLALSFVHGKGAVSALGFSPDGNHLVTGGLDRGLRVWEARTGRMLYDLAGHEGAIRSASWSPDGTFLTSLADGATPFLVWDTRTRLPVLRLKPDPALRQVVFTPDSTQLAGVPVGSDKVVLWDITSASEARQLQPQVNRRLESIAWTTDGKFYAILFVSPPGLKIWNAVRNEVVRELPLENQRSGMDSIVFSRDGKRLARGSWNQVQVWDVATGDRICEFPRSASEPRIFFSPDGKLLVGLDAGRVKYWNVETRREGNVLPGSQVIRSLALSPDGRRLALGRNDGTVEIVRVIPAVAGMPGKAR